ncbi:MAG: hypothetical protein LUE17_07745 [Planctomycetaceae bacterium]|nr:hypothetical protein [Planctomycetaceae bacterium]
MFNQALDRLDEFILSRRLGDKVGRALGQAVQHHPGFGVDAVEDDGRRRLFGRGLEPVEAGRIVVHRGGGENDEVAGGVVLQQAGGCVDTGKGDDRAPGAFDRPADVFPFLFVVFNDKNHGAATRRLPGNHKIGLMPL